MIRIGTPLYGYCGGYFEPTNCWGTKRVEALGVDWVVVRTDAGTPLFYFGTPEDLERFTDEDEA